ncbi:MAG: ribosome rescue protein RqcH, partial [Candidatus Aenigmatarchaeota archaeon]
MKEEMTSLDLHFLLGEIQGLIGGKFGKIYQRKKDFRIKIYVPGSGNYELVMSPGRVYLTQYNRQAPMQPPNFCMFLRKHLNRKTIREIKQHKFDRVLEIHTDENILIAEVFSKGNMILCDSSYNIIMPLEVQKWSDREISPDKKYKYPPSGRDPKRLSIEDFKSILPKKEIVKFLASDLGFGGTYAEEICSRASIDKNKPSIDLEAPEIQQVFKSMKEMFRNKNPQVIRKEGELFDVVPIEMEKYRNYEKEDYQSFSEALDKYFAKQEEEEIEDEKEEKFEQEVGKLERREKEQKEAEKKWKTVEKESKEKADLIYKNYHLIDSILTGINKAKDSGLSWSQVKKRIQGEDTPEADAIEEIREDDAKVLIGLEDKELELDFRKSIEENAERLYEDSKWARDKQESAQEAREETEEKKEEVKEKGKEDVEIKSNKKAPVRKKKQKDKWYYKYRWSITSEGFLVIGGKNAEQNEKVVKRQTNSNDVVLHAEIHGAPFIVVKNDSMDQDITPLAIREAAELAGAYSSAWKEGLGNVDVYWVNPGQLTKNPPSGESLGKGAFMVEGKKNYLRKQELKLSIGVKIDRKERSFQVMAGSVQSMRKNTDYFVTIKPGSKDKDTLAQDIKRKLMEKAA